MFIEYTDMFGFLLVVTFLTFYRSGQLYIVSHFIITTALQGIVISVFKRGKLICDAKTLWSHN